MLRISMMKFSLVLILLVSLLDKTNAQKKKKTVTDTLSSVREFVQVCNSYKTLPLHIVMELKNSSNFISGEDDTASIKAEFFMNSQSSYIRYGEAEQLVNDSMALLISDKIRQMVVFPNAQPIIANMKSAVGLFLKDSSLAEIAKKYTAQINSEKGKSDAVLYNRNLLYSTSLPKEIIELEYDPETKTPLKVITTQRSLIRLDSSDYESLKKDTAFAGKVLSIDDKGFFLVKEKVETFIYKAIDHDVNMKIPARITDRVIKNEQGEFIPVKGYKTYSVTVN